MIERLIDAYYTNEENSFLKKLKKSNLMLKIILIFYILGFIIVTLLLFICKKPVYVLISLIYTTISYCLIPVAEKIKRKNWRNSIANYNESLDKIADILKKSEFDLYEKIKIKQVIHKIKYSINEMNTQNEIKSNNSKDFIVTIIIPIITFMFGKTDIKLEENTTVAVLIVLLFTIVILRYFYKQIVYLISLINGNRIEYKKNFLDKLQDLLDRDFEINENDLI